MSKKKTEKLINPSPVLLSLVDEHRKNPLDARSLYHLASFFARCALKKYEDYCLSDVLTKTRRMIKKSLSDLENIERINLVDGGLYFDENGNVRTKKHSTEITELLLDINSDSVDMLNAAVVAILENEKKYGIDYETIFEYECKADRAYTWRGVSKGTHRIYKKSGRLADIIFQDLRKYVDRTALLHTDQNHLYLDRESEDGTPYYEIYPVGLDIFGRRINDFNGKFDHFEGNVEAVISVESFIEKMELPTSERKVIVGLLQGKSYQNIADELGIAKDTVYGYVRRLRQKAIAVIEHDYSDNSKLTSAAQLYKNSHNFI